MQWSGGHGQTFPRETDLSSNSASTVLRICLSAVASSSVRCEDSSQSTGLAVQTR